MTRFGAWIGRSVVAAAAAWGLVAGSPLRADDDIWKAAASGDWSAGASWVDGTTPILSDLATFNLPGAYTVTFTANPQPISALTLSNAANVTFASSSRPPSPIQPRTLPVTFASGIQDVDVIGGATLTLGATSGRFPASNDPFHLTAGHRLTVGSGSTLNVRFGSDVVTSALSANGQVNVIGSGSSLVSNGLGISNGQLNVTAGGDIVSGDSSIITADAAVDGNGSTWISQDLTVGFSGLGTLNITRGGRVTTRQASLGSNGFPSTAQVNVASTVPGVASIWVIDEDLGIGDFGGAPTSGTLLIQGGGTVSVSGNTSISRNGLLRLEGGTFSCNELLTFGVTERLSWIAGTLQVGRYNGDLTVPNSGVLAPVLSPDGTTINGDYNQQAAGSTLAIEIGGPFQFTDYGVLTSTGAVVLGGALQLTLTGGFVPTALNSFDILQADDGITGAFANVANGQRVATSDGLGSFLVNYGVGSPFDPNQVILSAFQPAGAFTADFDDDGDFDGDDLAQWRGDFGPSGGSDADGDGDSDGADFLAWQRQLGSGPPVTAASTPVPEPATVALLTLAAAGLGARQSRSGGKVPTT